MCTGITKASWENAHSDSAGEEGGLSASSSKSPGDGQPTLGGPTLILTAVSYFTGVIAEAAREPQ